MASGLTIGGLSDLTGMTPRNIRAHQSRGLLGPPRIDGRIAYYDAHHVARLELISSLQRDGSADIRPEVPLGAGLERLRAIDPSLPERLAELGLLRRDGNEWLVPTALAGVGRALAERGVPVELICRVGLEVAETAHVVAERLAGGLAGADDQDGMLVIAVQLNSAVFETALEHAATLLQVAAEAHLEPDETDG